MLLPENRQRLDEQETDHDGSETKRVDEETHGYASCGDDHSGDGRPDDPRQVEDC